MPGMKRAAALGGLALILLTSACGGNNEPAASPGTPTTTAPQAPLVTLHDSCAQVAAAMPKGFLPPASRWQTFQVKLMGISEAGDAKTKNALTGLQQAVVLLAADPANGSPYLEAEQALIDGLNNLNARCKSVGSRVLQ